MGAAGQLKKAVVEQKTSDLGSETTVNYKIMFRIHLTCEEPHRN